MNQDEKHVCALVMGLLRGAMTDNGHVRNLLEITNMDPVNEDDPLDPPTMVAHTAGGGRIEFTVNVVGVDLKPIMKMIQSQWGAAIETMDPEMSDKLKNWST